MTSLPTNRQGFEPVGHEEMLAIEGGSLWRAIAEVAATIIRAVLSPGSPRT